jgi:dipeptidyl aminopeptidase/acylaminoacyl peptidase
VARLAVAAALTSAAVAASAASGQPMSGSRSAAARASLAVASRPTFASLRLAGRARRSGRLVFSAERRSGPGPRDFGLPAIYVAHADGTRVRQLTAHHIDFDPDWSPNGRRIAFVRRASRGEASVVMVMDSRGGHLRRLTSTLNFDSQPTWSPDGRRIAFVRLGDIWVMKANGSDQRQLTNSGSASFYSPAWSPDGRRIAFVSSSGGVEGELITMRSRGSRWHVIAKHVMAYVGKVAWAPNGGRVAFTSSEPWYAVETVRPNGANRTFICSGVAGAWAPNGKALAIQHVEAFGSDPPSGSIWIAPLSGPSPREVVGPPFALDNQQSVSWRG